MTIWRQLAGGVRSLRNRAAADQELADEVEHYLELAAEAHQARGLSREEALWAARREVGGEARVREQVRSYGWENGLLTLMADLRYAGRRLRAAPGFTAAAIATLAIGIGGTTAVFSAVHPILFEPLPYPNAHRIQGIWERNDDGARGEGPFGMYHAFSERARSWEALAVLRSWRPTLTGVDRPERLEGQRVSADYFRVLGVAPVMGRDFQPSDDRLNGPDVVILSHRLWARRFGGDPGVVGTQVRLGDDGYLVIGVMPAGFENVLEPGAEIWAPLQYDLTEGRAWGRHLRTVGRLDRGVSPEVATRELNAIGAAIRQEEAPPTYAADVVWFTSTLQEDVTGDVRPALLAIMGAMTMVLLMACVNVTNLLLARGAQRRGEFALRAALGARSGRLVRQLLTESLFLATMGGAVGVAVAVAGVRAIVSFAPPQLPRLEAIGVNPTVFLFGLGITTLIGLAFGLVPALQAARGDRRDLGYANRRATGQGHHRFRGALVVAQVSLALVLLVSSGLLLRSLQRLFDVSPGFRAHQVLTMQVQTSGHRFAESGATLRFFDEALAAVRAVPGVDAAAWTSQLPLSGDLNAYGVHFASNPTPAAEEEGGAFRYAVSPGYLEAMDIPLLSGRTFTEQDRAGAPLAAIISESLARRYFPGRDAVGEQLRIGPLDGPEYTVVGVVGDVRQVSLALSQSAAVYTTPSQWRFEDDAMSLVVRGRGDAASLAAPVREAIAHVDRDQPVLRIAMMDDLLAASASQRLFVLALFRAFALAALALAAAGLYGVISGTVSERRREIGVRSALGATPGRIVALVLSQGFRLTLLGVVLGLPAAAALGRVMEAMLFDVSPLDPVTYMGVIALLAAVAALACGGPALRAAGVDPARTLRTD